MVTQATTDIIYYSFIYIISNNLHDFSFIEYNGYSGYKLIKQTFPTTIFGSFFSFYYKT